MIRHKAKSISNILKLLIAGFIFFEYHFQSIIKQAPLKAKYIKNEIKENIE